MVKSKTAIITGGSRGIGKAVSLKMAENGANIAILYSSSDEQAKEVVKCAEAFGVTARAYKCDVADFSKSEETVKKIIADFNGVDILVNNAGITRDKLILQMKEEDFDRVIDINLKGAFNMTKHIFSHLMKRRSGSIINISSVSGMMGNAGQANYASAKAGLIGLTKTVAKEIASRNVRCNAISPGFIATDMTDAMPDKVKEGAKGMIPLGHMGEPDDIANLAVFLASDLSSYITGEVIKVDGGLYT